MLLDVLCVAGTGEASTNLRLAALQQMPERTVLMPSPDKRQPRLYCSFCGKAEHEAFMLIAGPTVFICDECISLCEEMVAERRKEMSSERIRKTLSARTVEKPAP